MTIYIDQECKCYISPGAERTVVESSFFDGKCQAFIEGFRFVPEGQTWVRSDGMSFQGEMIAPWKPWAELDAAQRAYERAQGVAALAELDEFYRKGVDSV